MQAVILSGRPTLAATAACFRGALKMVRDLWGMIGAGAGAVAGVGLALGLYAPLPEHVIAVAGQTTQICPTALAQLQHAVKPAS